MKQKILICLICLAPILSMGCTSPKQVIVANSFERAMETEHNVVQDIQKKAQQNALDKMRDGVHRAIDAQDKNMADKEMLEFANETEEIMFLRIAHERARELFRLTQQYIEEQRGIFDILSDEWNQADQIVKEKKDSTPTE